MPVFEEVYVSIPDLDQRARRRARGSPPTAGCSSIMTKAARPPHPQMLTAKTRRKRRRADAWRCCARACCAPATSPQPQCGNVLTPEFQAFDDCVSEHDPRHGGAGVPQDRRVRRPRRLLYVRDPRISSATASAWTGCPISACRSWTGRNSAWTSSRSPGRTTCPTTITCLRKLWSTLGEQSVILCRCDTPRPSTTAARSASTLFQGKQVDTLMGGQAKAPSFLWSFSAPVHAHH